jgi:hypothetical protein
MAASHATRRKVFVSSLTQMLSLKLLIHLITVGYSEEMCFYAHCSLLIGYKLGSYDKYSVQTGSDVHPASYPMGTGVLYLGIKRKGRGSDFSPPSCVEVKNGGAIAALPHVYSCHDA